MRLVGAVVLALAGLPGVHAGEPEWRYTLRPGDTLIGVSERYLARPADWPRVQRLNSISNPYRLRPGAPLRIPVGWLRRQPASVQVTAVSGVVQSDGRVLARGATLKAGARIVTAADSSATLKFADGSVLTLAPQTTLELDTVSVYAGGGMADTQVRLQHGQIETRAERVPPGGRLEIRTPSAVAAVRGTHFRVGADPERTREETLHGAVGVRASAVAAAVERLAASVRVPAGHGSLTRKGEPPGAPVALLPAPGLAALPIRVDSLPLVFAWPAQAGASGWTAQLAPDAHFETLLASQTLSTPRMTVADLPDGHYQLRVRAHDALGLQGLDAVHAFELDARPFPPVLIGPAGVTRSADPVFDWSGVVGAQGYVFEWSTQADFSAATRIETTAPRTGLAAALTPGPVFWRVATVSAAEIGPFSPAHTLRYVPAPGPPDLHGSLNFAGDTMRIDLAPPAAGLIYDATLARAETPETLLWRGTSDDGVLRMPRPDAGSVIVAVRQREADGVAGPWAQRSFDVPAQGSPAWLLLPLLFAL